MSLIEHPSGGLARADFFCDTCHHDSGAYLLTTPAFYTPDFFKNYDKLGGRSSLRLSNTHTTEERPE